MSTHVRFVGLKERVKRRRKAHVPIAVPQTNMGVASAYLQRKCERDREVVRWGEGATFECDERDRFARERTTTEFGRKACARATINSALVSTHITKNCLGTRSSRAVSCRLSIFNAVG